MEILGIVGGPNEQIRGKSFLEQIKIYPDLSECEENSLWKDNHLLVRGKIRDRTYQILIFGLYQKALTVTANKGAIEAAKQQVISTSIIKK